MISTLVEWFAIAQGWLFESIVQPVLYHLGLGDITEQAFEGTEWFLIGLCELALLFMVLRPLESWIPVKRDLDPKARRIDFLYTCVHRLGAFTLAVFFVLDPLFDAIAGQLTLVGVTHFNLEQLWPGVTDIPLAAFFIYLVVLDFFDYWYHRASHQFNWWWGLHSLHHSQRDLNLWSDNRNHLLDDLLRDVVMAVIALMIGVEPSQYVLLVMASRMQQSLQHANVRIHFGPIGERLLVSPRYHRMHHAIGVGHESKGEGSLGGCNFAVLFPVWDILFRTANFEPAFVETGIRDQLPAPEGKGRNYGGGFWEQQWLGVKRMIEFARRAST
ncbi:Sterol desaturase/sphingolipid hydroxylase, fatty acid hydroxylase superfamily [Noviherbaspirillum humi]|uniref:Sterol desaturase/sphingolipid hydroxylase, fatty acid hydroxylase superfamily n=1 Tax=Noviherbaspirillum humi TaxID=1688639 RepID=A0A239GIC2_9BURK|nr:sterol desaturase family protein [Noviherbaspirillum humi]SNS68890.1 Sterol desaturase/sphingolipid hydroxylase, fatty acid hydroxylase superfamily [Noviherbaspirillum humi]